MSSLVGSLLSFVLLYKYAALFLIVFASAVAVPIPSGAVIVASFVFAGQGYMNTAAVALTATIGNIAGDIVGFALSRRFGREAMERFGLKKILHAPFVTRLERRVAVHPVITVFVTRLTTSITPIANLIVGFAALNWLAFIIADVAGQAVETGLNFFYGRIFGETWTYVAPITEKIGYLVIAVTALLAIFFWRRRAHRRALLAGGLVE
jgi:membrane protein DedA with SNARE-associated domain